MTAALPGLLLAAIGLIPPQFHPSLKLRCAPSQLEVPTAEQIDDCGMIVRSFALASGLQSVTSASSLEHASQAVLAVGEPKLVRVRARLEIFLAKVRGQPLAGLLETSLKRPISAANAEFELFNLAQVETDTWPFWHIMLFHKTEFPVAQNVDNLLKARTRLVLLEQLREICPEIERQLADPALEETTARRRLAKLCREGTQSLRRLLVLLTPEEVARTDAMRSLGEKKNFFQLKFFDHFMNADRYGRLVELRTQVAAIPLVLLFERKLECLGTMDVEACEEALAYIPQVFPPRPASDRAQQVRVERAQKFGLRLQRLLASELGPQFLSQMRELFVVSGAYRTAPKLDKLHEQLFFADTHKAGRADILAEFEAVQDLLPIFAFLRTKVLWNFESFVVNAFQAKREEPGNEEFMQFVLTQTKSGLFAFHRKHIFNPFKRLCSVFDLDAVPVQEDTPEIVYQVRKLCRTRSHLKIISLLDQFGLLDHLDALALAGNHRGILETLTGFFESGGLRRKPQHVQTAAELPEDEDERICIICMEPIASLADFRFLCAGKSQCCATCIRRWVREKGAQATCPNCREPLGAAVV